jgi:assimilatory nitrate reductase catalytic subunit
MCGPLAKTWCPVVTTILEEADLVVQVGSNMAWCHPVLYQRMMAAREKRGTKLVTIDPRRTATAETADLHLAIAPGADVILWSGLLVYLANHKALDPAWIAQHVCGFEDTLEAARRTAPSIAFVAAAADLRTDDVRTFYEIFAATERVVTLYSQGVNQSSSGTDKVNAILNCHLATARIGRPGMGPFSLTGQPNAMGGREVGGLANQLAVHMDFAPEAVERVQRFWSAPAIASRPGLKAVELFQAVAEGKIKALWIMGTNPLVSLPDADAAREALRRCPLVIVSDAVADTDTMRLARIKLPALTWGEKEGTVTNSERQISRQRAFLPKPGVAQPDWWAMTQVARRLGFWALFPYESPAAIFREHAALSGFENTAYLPRPPEGEGRGEGGSRRDFDLSALADLTDDGYDALQPVQWPLPRGATTGAPAPVWRRWFFHRRW